MKTRIKKQPPAPRDLMERTRAAVCLLNSAQGGGDGTKMAAFLELFHPEMKDQPKRALIREAASRPNLRNQ